MSNSKPSFKSVVDRLLKKRKLDDKAIEKQIGLEHTVKRWEVLKHDGVPKRIREQLRTIAKTKAVERVNEFLASEDDWCLILSSTPGTGKSTAAAYFLWCLTEGREVPSGPTLRKWMTAAELATFNAYSDDFHKLVNLGILVIDDVGAEYSDSKGHFRRLFDTVIDSRYREELPTIITTNLNAKDFKSRYGDRVVDRIREGGTFFEFKAKSMRKK